MNLVLIGYRGTGKSVIARRLAKRLGMEVIGMDGEIVRRAGRSIPEIVEAEGWPVFRDLETALAKELSERDAVIIDCGGGVIERPENVEALKAGGRVFWLKASVDTIVSRIGGDNQRPSLTGTKSFTDEVTEVLERRTPLYAAAAQHAVDTDGKAVYQVVDEILAIWQGLAS
jgi:shikimate kinase